MKKISLLLVLIVIVSLFVACTPEKSEPEGPAESANIDYATVVKDFREVSITEAREEAEKGEEFYLYIGYEGCPYCEKFVPVLAEAMKKHDLTILYADATHKDDEDFQAFMEELDFRKVPAIFTVKDKTFNKIKIKSPYTLEKVEDWLGLE